MCAYIFMFLSLVLGTFIGMGGALLLFSSDGRKHRRKPKDNDDEPREDEPPLRIVEQNESADDEIPEGSLTRKIPSKDFSVTDFNCAADEVEADEHIAARQQTQDNAYNALKRRKK